MDSCTDFVDLNRSRSLLFLVYVVSLWAKRRLKSYRVRQRKEECECKRPRVTKGQLMVNQARTVEGSCVNCIQIHSYNFCVYWCSCVSLDDALSH
jgi:hypothetical protein